MTPNLQSGLTKTFKINNETGISRLMKISLQR